MSAFIAISVFAVMVVSLIATQHSRNASRWRSDEPLPADLSGAKLFVSEKEYSVRRPFPLIGRPDQVYRVGRRLIVTDTKRRRKACVYQGDLVQLSLYRLLLDRAVNPWWRRWLFPYTVDRRAWLRCVTPGKVTYVPVETISEQALVDLHERYRSVQRREVSPRQTASPVLCAKCNYSNDCPHGTT